MTDNVSRLDDSRCPEGSTDGSTSPTLSDAQQQAAAILMRTFSSHPEAVLVVSLGNGQVLTSISPFPNAASVLLAKELALRACTQAFDEWLVQDRKARDSATESNPPPDSL